MREYAYEYADVWNHVPTPLERAGGLWLVRAGRNVGKPHYFSGPKQIEYYGFHFILAGGLQLEYEGGAVMLGKDDLFCLQPHTTYTYRSCAGEPLQMVWLTLDGPQAAELVRAVGVGRERPYCQRVVDRTMRQTLRLITDALTEGPRRALRRSSLLLRLMEQLERSSALASGPTAEAAGMWPEGWLERTVEFFRLHFAEPIRIEEAARLAGVHRSHFTARFTRQTGMPPQQFVVRLRMEKAKQLLQETALSITEIAGSVGYPDLYTFSRAFKLFSGHSPSGCRRSMRGEEDGLESSEHDVKVVDRLIRP